MGMAAAGMVGAAGSVIQGIGGATTAAAQARLAQQQAYIGKIKAKETDAGYREQLATTLANIDAVRATVGADPWSPTAMAIKANEQRIGDRQRRTAVFNIMEQVSADKEAASIYRSQAGYALAGGVLGGLASGLRGFS